MAYCANDSELLTVANDCCASSVDDFAPLTTATDHFPRTPLSSSEILLHNLCAKHATDTPSGVGAICGAAMLYLKLF